MTAFATFLFRMKPTPCLCSISPEYIIVWLPVVIFPLSVHLVSDTPIMSRFMLFISCIALSSFPVLDNVLTFHVPILKGFSLVFRATSSENNLPAGFRIFSSYIDLLAVKVTSSSL